MRCLADYLTGDRLIFEESSNIEITEYGIHPARLCGHAKYFIIFVDAAVLQNFQMNGTTEVSCLGCSQLGQDVCSGILRPWDLLNLASSELSFYLLYFLQVFDH